MVNDSHCVQSVTTCECDVDLSCVKKCNFDVWHESPHTMDVHSPKEALKKLK